MRHRARRLFVALLPIVALGGCRREQPAATVRDERPAGTVAADAGTVARRAADRRDAASAAGDGAAEPAGEPIDLLRGVRTDVAVSSAYRDQPSHAAGLVDGDLATAWNSRTGDLVGAWIEVRLPEDASVTSIALTAGFTRSGGRSDLFTGNHRVSKLRVLRAGQELGVFGLDVESRELQTLPVQGPGGVYRIEVVEVLSGSRAQWRETCVSELRVMGRAPASSEGLRLPRVSVGALPEPRTEPGSADREDVGRQLRQLTTWLAREWGALSDEQGARRRACALDEEDLAATADLDRRRRQVFARVAELVDLVDELHADRLRLAALERVPESSGGWTFLRPDDHDRLAAGVEAVVDWLGEEGARCRWATASAGLRLGMAVDEVRAIDHQCEHIPMDFPEGAPREVLRECRGLERILPRLEELRDRWGSDPRLAAERIERLELPELTGRALAEWTAVRAQTEVARRSCGWAGEP